MRLGLGAGRVRWCYLGCELRVRILCVNGMPRYLYIVLGRYLRILGTPSVQSYCALSIYASYRVYVSGIVNPDLFACGYQSFIDNSHFYEEQCQQSSGVRRAGLSKKHSKTGPHYWGREVSTQFAQQFSSQYSHIKYQLIMILNETTNFTLL